METIFYGRIISNLKRITPWINGFKGKTLHMAMLGNLISNIKRITLIMYGFELHGK